MHDKRGPDQKIARVAARQHGAISSVQLRHAGLSRDAILQRRRAGRLHPLHRGVYAVGHLAPSDERRWMAAVLALDSRPEHGPPAAALSHRAAAELWGLLKRRGEPVDVSASSRGGKRKRRGIRVHRPISLTRSEIVVLCGIPVTSPARTLADLRVAVSRGEFRHAARQADYLGLGTGPEVDSDRTRSELERRFLWLCRRHRLPRPAVNVQIGRLTVDFYWEDRRLVVETDGYRAHRGLAAFEDDRARDLELGSRGYEVQHFSHRQVFNEPQRVVALLRARLTVRAR